MSRLILSAVALAVVASVASAQCPNGIPQSCRRAPGTHVTAPLDNATWIVLPFANTAHASDVDWLRDASGNLLYLELSRFSDIRVIDDERVATMLRPVVGAGNARRALTLDEGMAIAKQAGAGRLVMGDILKAGSRTAVVAKVYDVGRGQRLRSAREETATPDSAISLFARMAPKILNLPGSAGTDTRGGIVGTNSLSAYQAYLDGVSAMNRIDLAAARTAFNRALLLDSSFALAHYKLAIVEQWALGSAAVAQRHAEAAAALFQNLPNRERTLITAERRFAVYDYPGACTLYHQLVQADSTDVDALFGVGECEFHDNLVVPANADSSKWRFRGSWNTAIAAFHRVLELDPANHLAFQHIVDALSIAARFGCRASALPTRCSIDRATFVTGPRRDADSLLLDPIPLERLDVGTGQIIEARRSGSQQRNIEEALRIGREWLASGPSEPRPHIELAGVLVALGRFDEATTELQAAGSRLSPAERVEALEIESLIALRRGDGARYGQVIDSVMAIWRSRSTGIDVTRLSMLLAIEGRMAVVDSNTRSTQIIPPPIVDYALHAFRLVLGAGTDSAIVLERAADALAGMLPGSRLGVVLLSSTLRYGLLFPRATWPSVVDRVNDHGLAAAKAMAHSDTATLRRIAMQLDSAGVDTPDPGDPVMNVDIHLALGDSTGALALVRQLDRAPVLAQFQTVSGLIPTPLFAPRLMLLRGDLAAALGQRDEARESYGRWLSFWDHADAEFALLVARVRKSYREVGGPP